MVIVATILSRLILIALLISKCLIHSQLAVLTVSPLIAGQLIRYYKGFLQVGGWKKLHWPIVWTHRAEETLLVFSNKVALWLRLPMGKLAMDSY